jgi:chloramphenicol 3-O-phosphotransferase
MRLAMAFRCARESLATPGANNRLVLMGVRLLDGRRVRCTSEAVGEARAIERPDRVGGLNRSRGKGYGLTLEVRERPVTRLYVGE